MPDVYNTITTAEPSMIQRIAIALEVRAADRQQQRMLESYLHEIQFPPAAKVVEVGCGTGPVARRLATWPNVAEVIGLDPSSVFIAKARRLGQHRRPPRQPAVVDKIRSKRLRTYLQRVQRPRAKGRRRVVPVVDGQPASRPQHAKRLP